MAEIFFLAMLGLLATHELDAMKRHEWRLLPVTSGLPDHVGAQVFLWLHVPIFAGLGWIAAAGAESAAAKALSGFALVHVGLHWLYRNHPKNEFGDPVSWSLIWGGGAFGALHLVVTLPG